MNKLVNLNDTAGCTARQARFVDLYLLLNFNATRAYLEAGYEAKSDHVAGAASARLLGNVRVRALLAARAKAMIDNVEAEKAKLMRTLTGVAFCDVRELVTYQRGSCRFCWGKAHRYQFSAGEWDAKMLAFEERQEKAAESGGKAPSPPDQRGGTGYDWKRDPNPDCPECSGFGEGRQIIADMRHLSPEALALYNGVEQTKDGLRVKTHDQAHARDQLAKIRKLVDEDVKVSVTFDPAELEKLYAEKMEKSRERGEAIRRERFGSEGG